MKDVLSELENNIKFIKVDKGVFYVDIGYGEMFVTLSLSVFNPQSLVFYSSLQSLKEILRRFLNIKTPKGFRTRVFLYKKEHFENFINIYNLMNQQNILYHINLDYAGSGSNIIGIYKMEEEDIKKIIKISEKAGIYLSFKNIKKDLTPDKKSIVFLKDENSFFIESLDRSYYHDYLINKSVIFTTNFLNRVI